MNDRAMALIALVIYVLGAMVGIVWRSWWQWRRTGSTGFRRRGDQSSGTSRSISSSQVRADMSDGARQSPRGDSDPPCDTFGPLGNADRLNWLNE